MQRISLALLINLHVMDPPLIQVLGFKDTYIWLKDDNPSQKKRGTPRLTKALNANFKVTLLYSLFSTLIILNSSLLREFQNF